jgi:hypothetical protein
MRMTGPFAGPEGTGSYSTRTGCGVNHRRVNAAWPGEPLRGSDDAARAEISLKSGYFATQFGLDVATGALLSTGWVDLRNRMGRVTGVFLSVTHGIAAFGEDGGVVRFELLRASRVVEDADQVQFAITG